MNIRKALALDTPVYSRIVDRGDKYPQKTIGDLKVGDFIYDEKGELTEVLHLNPIIFDDVFEVEFEDGEVIECNAEHLWNVYDKNFKKREERKTCLRNTYFLYDNFKINSTKSEYRFHVPVCNPIKYPNIQNLTIDPYLLGVWLGDGCKNTNRITSGKQDVEELTKLLKQTGSIVTVREETNNRFSLIVDREKDFDKSEAKEKSFLKKLRNLGVYNNKRIPERYLYASVEDRIALLQGLMDTDGHCDSDGHCEISQSAEHLPLLQDISKLLNSLGIKNNINYKKSTCRGKQFDAYRINFRTDKTMSCFRFKRKEDRLPNHSNLIVKTKAIVDVRKTNKKKPMRCITVSNDSGLFLCGKHATVTHNSYLSSPYIMARSILIPNHKTFILCPAGNQAQETFGKMEDLAKGQIASVTGATSVFWDELKRNTGTSDGFVHDKISHHCELYNGSEVRTVNSVPKNIVGIRSKIGRFKIKSHCDFNIK